MSTPEERVDSVNAFRALLEDAIKMNKREDPRTPLMFTLLVPLEVVRHIQEELADAKAARAKLELTPADPHFPLL